MGSISNADFRVESRLRAAARGDANASYDLGVFYSTDGDAYDLIEAHKWFNLSAVAGNVAAQRARAEISEDMSARQIATAQAAARALLATSRRHAA